MGGRSCAYGFVPYDVGCFYGSTRRATTNSAATNGNTPDAYYVDALFRAEPPRIDKNDVQTRLEAGRILDRILLVNDAPASESEYLSTLVAADTGLSAADAQRRVSNVLTDARQAEDTARKAIAHALLWIFLALLMGAFCASFGATIGGRQRDHMKSI